MLGCASPCRYGWLLPGGAAGQGRGSRSFVHVTRASALMHDASYMCPLLLRCCSSPAWALPGFVLDYAVCGGGVGGVGGGLHLANVL